MKLSKKNPKKGSKSGVIDQVISRKSSTRNPFTPEEDQILLEAMRSGEKVDCTTSRKIALFTSYSGSAGGLVIVGALPLVSLNP